MSKKTILFVNFPTMPLPQLEKWIIEGKRRIELQVLPFGVLYLSSYLKKHLGSDVDVHILDIDTEMGQNTGGYPNFETMIKVMTKLKSEEIKPDIIAYSVLFSIQHVMMDMAVKIHQEFWPNAIKIVGGNHASNVASSVFENPNVDYLGRGECEHSFMEFVKAIIDGNNNIPQGIYSRSHFQDKLSMPISLPVNDLDDIPYPDWDLLDMEHYVTSREGASIDARTCSIFTTRGCPFSCTFCASHTTMGRKVRFRSIDNVIEEILQLNERFGVNKYVPEDDLFTANRRKVIPLLNEIEKVKADIEGFELAFPNALSVNTLFDDVMDALIRAGMVITDIAIESGSPYVQKNIIKKNVKLDRGIHVVRYLRSRGVIARANIIFGFPRETKEMIQETVDYVYELGADWIDSYVAAPLCGSEMFDEFVEMGVVEESRTTWANAFYTERTFDTEEITATEIKHAVYALNLKANFNDNINYREGKFEPCAKSFEHIIKFHPHHIFALFMLAKIYTHLGNIEDSKMALKNIRKLIETNEQSEELYREYVYLFEDFDDIVYDDVSMTLAAQNI